MHTRYFVLMSSVAAAILPGGCRNSPSAAPSRQSHPSQATDDTAAQSPSPSTPDSQEVAVNQSETHPDVPAAPQTSTIDSAAAAHGSSSESPHAPPPPAAGSGAGAKWLCNDSVQEFGEVWQGKKLDFTFHFRNDGLEPLKILEAKSKCGCTVPQDYTKLVEPGHDGTVKAILKTSNIEGDLVKTLDLKTNDPRQPIVTLRMKGKVKAPFEIRPRGGFNFGQMSVSSKLAREVVLTNKSATPISLQYVPPPRESKIFHVAFEVVRPGHEYRVTVTANPPLPEGSSKLSLNFKTNIPDLPDYNLLARVNGATGVVVTPKSIVIRHPYKDPQRRFVRITTYAKTPAEIVGAAVSDPRIIVTRSLANQIEVVLPAEYQPPAYGEVIEIHTNDKDQPTIRLPVIPSTNTLHPKRPKDKPLVMTPVELVDAKGLPPKPSKELPPQLRPSAARPVKPTKPK